MNKEIKDYQQFKDYALLNTKAESLELKELFDYTINNIHGSQMLSGRIIISLIQILIKVSSAKLILELGTYSGYATLGIAESLPDDGKIISIDKSEISSIMDKKFIMQSIHANKIQLLQGDILDILPDLDYVFDFIFIDADKIHIPEYFELSLNKLAKGGLIVIDNSIWQSKVFDPTNVKAAKLNNFNQKLAVDPRVENVLLPMIDGVNIVRKI